MVVRDSHLFKSLFHPHTSSTLHDAVKWDVGQLRAQRSLAGKKRVTGDEEGDLDRV